MKETLINSNILFQGLALLLLFFIIPLQIVIRNDLMTTSAHFLMSLQTSRTSTGISTFSVIEYSNELVLFSIICPFVLNFLEPIRVPKVILLFCFSFYLSNFLALLFQEDRPFWFTKDLTGEVCLEGYGNPSIEVILLSVVFSTISIEIFHDKSYRIVVYCIILCAILFLALGLLYLGENFPHQVLTSLFISFIIVTLSFTFDKALLNGARKSCHFYKKNRVVIVKWYLFLLGMAAVVLAIDAMILSFSEPTPKTIVYAIAQCRNSYMPDGNRNIYGCCSMFYVMGFMIGSQHLTERVNIYWSYTKWWKSLIRFVISAGYAYGIYTLFRKF